jgi:hypothetical protein
LRAASPQDDLIGVHGDIAEVLGRLGEVVFEPRVAGIGVVVSVLSPLLPLLLVVGLINGLILSATVWALGYMTQVPSHLSLTPG